MSTGSRRTKRDFAHTSWFLLAFSLLVGFLMFGASVIGGHFLAGLVCSV